MSTPLYAKADGIEDILKEFENSFDEEIGIQDNTSFLEGDTYIINVTDVGEVRSTIPGKGVYESATFWFDDTIDYDLMLDGKDLVVYSSGDTILACGDYELFLYPSDDSVTYGLIEFTVENDLGVEPVIQKMGADMDDLFSFESIDIYPEVGYDIKSGQIVYKYNDEILLYTTVPNGGTAVGEAGIVTVEGSINSVMYNNEYIEFPKDGHFTDSGSYDLLIQNYLDVDDKSMFCTFKFHFVIIDEKTNVMGVINAPVGFHISDLKCDGILCDYSDAFAFLDSDGEYEVTFECDTIDWLSITSRFIRDTVLPEVHFDEELKAEGNRAPVTFTVESGCSFEVVEAGIPINVVENSINKPGRYNVRVKDEAGNVTNVTVFVKKSFDFDKKSIIIIAGVIVILSVGWFIFTRRKYRVL